MCEQIVQQFMSTWLDQHLVQHPSEKIIQQEVLRLALRSRKPIRPRDVSNYLCVHLETARRILRDMTKENILLPNGTGTLRVHSYVVNLGNVNERVIL